MKCKYCGSENVRIETLKESKPHGCMSILGWVLLTVLTGGIGLVIMLLSGTLSSANHTYAICQDCGKKYKID